ncbi:MAG: condensation domain-containing protein, partial [Acidobacteria bacterium]|nr:condensation domain-containing protein [Acidobacteriota bacterium]
MSDIEKGMVFYSAKSLDKALYYDQFVYMRQYRDFNPGIFQEALALMTAKHENLRTSYNTADFDGFVHFIHRTIPPAYQHFDIAGFGEADQEKYIADYMTGDRKRERQIGTPPLWRMATFDLGGGRVCAVWSFHHAILDGWSNASLMTELNNTYLDLKAGKKESPGRLKITYKDFVAHEMAAKKKASLSDFWKIELQDYKRIAFPGGKRGEAWETEEIVDFLPPYSARLNEMLVNAAKQHHTSIKNLCFGAYLYMLNMLTYENDITAGLISHNRPEAADGDKLIGCCLNTLPVRLRIPAETTCEEYIYLVDSKLLQLRQYEKITFYEIVKIIGAKNYDGNPILDTIFNYVDFHIYRQAAADDLLSDTQGVNRNREIPPGYERANTLFDFIVSPYAAGAGGISILMRYAVSIIDADMVQKLYSYFETILERLVSREGLAQQ